MKLNQLFTSRMVLPAHKEIRIFGSGEGTAKITFNGITRSCISTKGEWMITFPKMEYGGPYEMVADLNGKKTVLTDIYVGVVYIFAGQSNMQFKIHESLYSKEKWSSNNNIRLFSTDRVEDGEYFFAKDGWITAQKSDVGNWPAIPYLTAMELSKKGVAVGAITCYQGASVIESWVPKGTFEKVGINIPIGERHKDHVDEWFGKWNLDAQLYDFTFKKIAPFSVSGVVWYQGESDASVSEGMVYDIELCELIKVWRNDLYDNNLPFVVIQIADYDEKINDDGWHLVQEAQLRVEKMLPCVKTVISRDVCESDNIHPATKEILSLRVADALIKMR